MLNERKLDMEEILIYFYLKYNKDWDSIFGAINRKERVTPEEVFETVDNAKKTKNFVTLLSDEYPEEYKATYKPPFVLEYEKVEC